MLKNYSELALITASNINYLNMKFQNRKTEIILSCKTYSNKLYFTVIDFIINSLGLTHFKCMLYVSNELVLLCEHPKNIYILSLH